MRSPTYCTNNFKEHAQSWFCNMHGNLSMQMSGLYYAYTTNDCDEYQYKFIAFEQSFETTFSRSF